MLNRSCHTSIIKRVRIASVFLCMFFCAGASTYAQSYFHLQVQATTPDLSYNYFLHIEADGSSRLRIAYTAEGKIFLAEVMMADSLLSDTIRALVPTTSPRFIKGTSDDNLWLPVIQFESRTDSTGVYYEPAAVTLIQGKNEQQTTLLTAKQKTYEELVQEKPLVLQFYEPNERFYFFLSGFTTRNLNINEQKRKFYLIIIANTNDDSIGESAQKDLAGISEIFTTLTKQAGITLVRVIVSGTAFNIGNTRTVIDSIKPEKEDIIFFYYSGHGFREKDDRSNYPRISFRSRNNPLPPAVNNLSMEEDVYKKLLAKKARVTIVVSDCCNAEADASVPFGMDMLRPRATGTEGLKLNYDNFRKLFLPHQKTSILIGSASKKQLAAGNPKVGGFFTNFFKAELIKNLYSNTEEGSWMRISRNATENTQKQSLTAECSSTPNVRGRCIQRAELKVLPPR